uniref:Uncharacterized protein n=1 Tax=Cacopsylla melanoneura TaxID=428564 RepID=A0A8D8TBM7_9HEMI
MCFLLVSVWPNSSYKLRTTSSASLCFPTLSSSASMPSCLHFFLFSVLLSTAISLLRSCCLSPWNYLMSFSFGVPSLIRSFVEHVLPYCRAASWWPHLLWSRSSHRIHRPLFFFFSLYDSCLSKGLLLFGQVLPRIHVFPWTFLFLFLVATFGGSFFGHQLPFEEVLP